MSYPTGLHAVSHVLSRMCVTTSVCPFFKGASCPIESYMRKKFPAFATMKDVCLCGLASEDKWYSFLIDCVKQDIANSSTTQRAD